MQWQTEIERRCVSFTELAAAAGVHPVTVSRIVKGERAGYPRSRRALWAALMEFEAIVPQTPADAPVMLPPDPEAIRAAHEARKAQLEARKTTWQ